MLQILKEACCTTTFQLQVEMNKISCRSSQTSVWCSLILPDAYIKMLQFYNVINMTLLTGSNEKSVLSLGRAQRTQKKKQLF